MRTLVVFGAEESAGSGPAARLQRVTIDGVTVPCGIVRTADVRFDPASAADRRRVLVRVRAVSCNYRDKVFITALRNVPASRFSAIGSEFVAEVVDVGAEVTSLRRGDRVIPDFHYEGRQCDAEGVPAGIPTNRASRAVHVLHERQLCRAPESMPDAVAAAFALNAQTAYSMTRRLAPRAGAAALVTSASSNVSLFVLGALRHRGVRLYATTSSPAAAVRLAEAGVAKVAVVPRRRAEFAADEGLAGLAADARGFDYVFDPFFDLHLTRAVQLMNPFGAYVTCGFAGQTPGAALTTGVDGALPMHDVLTQAIVKNLTLVGNCIGRREDLDHALRDYAAGLLRPVLDSVFSGDDAAAFLDRTFNDPARFGKVVFRYV